uniref:Structure-specific endonuclease subunit SLX1 homolog n=1 Tax=Auxenochlorella protothecoides TaxID=3075 RepID=A0A1D2A861_AUXPR
MPEVFGCYLLRSCHAKGKGRTYIGFTVNPSRRLRQHNGDIVSGAAKTKRLRPWEMVLFVHGFPTAVTALQFEWAWQHPEVSLDVRAAAQRLGKKRLQGVQGKVRLLHEMLNLEPWRYFPLSLHILSSAHAPLRAQCPPLPAHIAVTFAPLEDLDPGYDIADESTSQAEEEAAQTALGSTNSMAPGSKASSPAPSPAPSPHASPSKAGGKGACRLCAGDASRTWWACSSCDSRFHLGCLARHLLEKEGGTLPSQGSCPTCEARVTWREVLRDARNAGWVQHQGARTKSSPAARRRAAGRAAASKAQKASPLASPASHPSASPSAAPAARPRGRPRKLAMGEAERAVEGAPAPQTAPGMASPPLAVELRPPQYAGADVPKRRGRKPRASTPARPFISLSGVPAPGFVDLVTPPAGNMPLQSTRLPGRGETSMPEAGARQEQTVECFRGQQREAADSEDPGSRPSPGHAASPETRISRQFDALLAPGVLWAQRHGTPRSTPSPAPLRKRLQGAGGGPADAPPHHCDFMSPEVICLTG